MLKLLNHARFTQPSGGSSGTVTDLDDERCRESHASLLLVLLLSIRD